MFLTQKFKPASLSFVQKMQSVVELIASKPLSIWHRLTTAERLYALATLLLIFTTNWYGFIAILATIALSIEFWPIFTRMWHSLAGKAVILLFYAIIANFALVSASGVVNEVIGVSAESLTYTHNFAILLYLPVWLFSLTIVVLALMQIGLPIYLVLLLMLKPFGMRGVRLVAKSEFPFLVAFVRLLLGFVVLFHLFLLMDADGELTEDQLNGAVAENLGFDIDESGEIPEFRLSIGKQSSETVSSETMEDPASKSGVKTKVESEQGGSDAQQERAFDSEGKEIANDKDETVDDEKEKPIALADRYIDFSKALIADFAFKLESDSFSRCQISQGARVIELNDYEILEIKPDENQQYGYQFEVKKCISPAFPASK